MRAKRKFIDLTINEVSLVADPACPPATIKITKARGQMDRINTVVKASTVECRICAQKVADEDKFCKSCGAPFYKTAPKEESVPEEKIEPVAEAAPEPVVEAAPAVEPEPVVEPPPAVEVAPVQAAVEPAPEPEPVQKAEATEVEKANIRVAELEKSLRETRRIVKVKDATTKIESVMKSIPAKADELADRLVALAELDAPLAEYVEMLLAKCAALIETNVLPATASVAVALTGTALERAEALAEKLAKERGISKAKALAEVWKTNKDLYKSYEQEKLEAR